MLVLNNFIKNRPIGKSNDLKLVLLKGQTSRPYSKIGRHLVFTARCYASAVLAMGPCLCLSVCLSQVGVLLKRLNVGSHKQHHTIAQGLSFSDAKDLREIRLGSPPTRAPNAGGVGQNRRLSTNIRLYLESGKR